MSKRHKKKNPPPAPDTFKNQLITLGLLGGLVLGIIFGFFITRSLVPTPLSLSFAPAAGKILQGEPVEFILFGTSTPAAIRGAVLWQGRSATPLHFAPYDGRLVAFYGVPLSQMPGTSTITVTLRVGVTLSVDFQISTRPRPQEYLPVPAQLGGNSVANQENLVSVLSQENATLKAVTSTSTALWSEPFRFPVASPTVTDKFGITRDSGAVAITHEGTDFAAAPGTPVYAINRGIVKIAEPFTAYGNTIVLDHGVGVQSLYMHLSEIDVKPGQVVQRGQLLGLSGETGYSEGPHLHLSIKIAGVSIDPLKFLALFKS